MAPMTSPTAVPKTRGRPRGAPSAREIAVVVGLFVVSAIWGAAWKRTAALVETSSFLPIFLLLIGPGALVAYFAYRAATGQLVSRTVLIVSATVAGGALVGNLVTPPLAASVDVAGRLSGTLDGAAVDGAATCTWGPGRTNVIVVTTPLAANPAAESNGSYFTANIPSGTLTVEPPSGTVYVTDIPAALNIPRMPLRIGSGAVGQGDQSTGTVTLEPAQDAAVSGSLSWNCDPAPPG
jgi:hypothetical protein